MVEEQDGETNNNADPDGLTRRTVLQAVSIAAVGSAAYGALPGGDSVAAYGYGGSAVTSSATLLESATESEPNDDIGTAMAVATGTELAGSLVGSEVDWYTYDLPSTEAVTVRLTRPSTSGVVGLVLYTPSEEFLDSRFVSTDAVEYVFTPATSGAYFVQVVNVEAGEGDYTLTVATESDQTTTTEEPTTTVDDGQDPYGGSNWALPGRIEAEDYDTGGQDVAYSDTSSGNKGSVYRTDDVDIQAADDVDGAYNIAWTRDGEWLEYTVDVAGGTYDIDLRVASPKSSGRLRVLLDGAELGATDVPKTGGWQKWSTLTFRDVTVDSGSGRVLRIEIPSGGFNLNHVSFRATDSGSTTPTTTTVADDFGEQSYGEYGYGGATS